MPMLTKRPPRMPYTTWVRDSVAVSLIWRRSWNMCALSRANSSYCGLQCKSVDKRLDWLARRRCSHIYVVVPSVEVIIIFTICSFKVQLIIKPHVMICYYKIHIRSCFLSLNWIFNKFEMYTYCMNKTQRTLTRPHISLLPNTFSYLFKNGMFAYATVLIRKYRRSAEETQCQSRGISRRTDWSAAPWSMCSPLCSFVTPQKQRTKP